MRDTLAAAVKIGVVAVAIVLVFIAWWIAVLAVGGVLAYLGVRRLLGKGRAPLRQKQADVIEGEYRVEPEALPDRRRPGER
jgi:hypothetical protein